MCVWRRGQLGGRRGQRGSPLPLSQLGSVFRSKVAGKSAAITGGQGKQKILAGIPRRQELPMTSTWLHLETLCTQMKNEFVTSVRASGTQKFSESRNQPESQTCLGSAFCPGLSLCSVLIFSFSTSVHCALQPLAPSSASPLRLQGTSVLFL